MRNTGESTLNYRSTFSEEFRKQKNEKIPGYFTKFRAAANGATWMRTETRFVTSASSTVRNIKFCIFCSCMRMVAVLLRVIAGCAV